MIVRGIDGSGDWLYGKGKNDYKTGLEAIKQNLSTRILSFLGDCFFDTNAGIDWFNLLGAKNQLAIELAVSAVILNTENIVSLEELTITRNAARQLTISYQAESTLGLISAINTVG